MRHDILEALRSAVRTPLLSAAVVLSLGLGIGMNTAVFSVVNAVLLRPLPFPEPERIVQVRGGLRADGVEDTLLAGAVFSEVRRSATRLEEVAAVAAIRQNLTGAGLPEQVQVGWVSTNLFRMLGVRPALGRVFADDEPPGRVLLDHGFWRRHFAADPGVIGRRVFLDGFAYEVVGVMPAGFRLELPRMPVAVDVWKAPDTWWQNGDVWSSVDLGGGILRVIARLRPDAGADAAHAELDAIATRLRERDLALERAGFFLTADPLQRALVSRARAGLLLLLGASLAVLLVACANVMNLQLVRGQRRSRELALRLAIGASRGRLVRLLLFEAVTLAAAGGLVGLGLAAGALRLLLALRPADLPLAEGVRLDPVVLAFATAVCLAAALLFGLLPALFATRRDPARELHGARAAPGPRRAWAGASLVAAQIALSLVLLLGGGLMAQSLLRQGAVPLGFRGEGLLTFTLSMPGARYERPLGPDRFLARVAEAIEALPGARSAAAVWPLPFSGRRWSDAYEAGAVDAAQRATADYRLVSPAFFETVGATLVDGRSFAPGDSRHSVVVSRGLAERAFPGQSAVGRGLRANPWGGRDEEFRIVGVVDDQRHRSRREEPTDAIYFDSRGWSWTDWEIGVVVRAQADPRALVEPIRREIARLDPEIPMADVQTMAERLRRDTSAQRFALGVLGAFAVSALVLAVVGLYGVMSWTVVQRTREIGIRLALGATRGRVLAGVVGRGALVAGIGTAVGLAASAATTRLLSGLLFGVSAGEPQALAAAAGVLLACALVAAYLPARRAAAVDPALTLRSE
jgi:putative ABC transport system permease protein